VRCYQAGSHKSAVPVACSSVTGTMCSGRTARKLSCWSTESNQGLPGCTRKHAYMRMPCLNSALCEGPHISVLLIRGLILFRLSLFRLSVRADPLDAGGLAEDQFQYSCSGAKPGAIRGIVFLWFIGVLRDRLGACEDQNGELTDAALAVATRLMVAWRFHGELRSSSYFPSSAAARLCRL